MGQIDESVSIFEACEKSAACRRNTKLVSRRIKHYEQSRTFVDKTKILSNLECFLMIQKHFEDFFFETFVLLLREHYILIMFHRPVFIGCSRECTRSGLYKCTVTYTHPKCVGSKYRALLRFFVGKPQNTCKTKKTKHFKKH
jgi:hypothetical protein